MFSNIKSGQIRYVNLKGDTALQGGVRPALIIQNNKGCIYSPRIWIIPFTTKTEKATHLPMHIFVKKSLKNKLKEDSVLLVEQAVNTLKENIGDLVGNIEEEYMLKAGMAWNNNCPMFSLKVLNSINDCLNVV